MDLEKFKDFAPYRGEDVELAKERLMSRKEYLGAFAYILSGNDIENMNLILGHIASSVGKVHSYTDFQRYVTAGLFIPTILKKTTTKFTVRGTENLDPSKGYLFISNHRDIVLDCMLLDYGLLLNNLPFCEMAVGDNLLANQFVEDIFRINGGIIIKRDLPMREKYLETLRQSEYIVETVKSGVSIWVAQKSGRSKDGIDQTHPAIIKMLYMSKKGSGIAFSDLIKEVNIVPVAISYQYDPNDINKGREEVIKSANGKYEKKKYEDLISMVKGMRCPKGEITVSIGSPLTEDYQKPEDVCREIDRQIHLGYQLYDTNYIAYDYLEHTSRFTSHYTEESRAKFLASYDHLSKDVREFVLASYANPVRMYLKEIEGEER